MGVVLRAELRSGKVLFSIADPRRKVSCWFSSPTTSGAAPLQLVGRLAIAALGAHLLFHVLPARRGLSFAVVASAKRPFTFLMRRRTGSALSLFTKVLIAVFCSRGPNWICRRPQNRLNLPRARIIRSQC